MGRTYRAAVVGGCIAAVCGAATAETVTYTYDVFGEVTNASVSTGPANTYTYDAAGNRTQLTTAGGANQAPLAVNDSISTPAGTAKTFDPRTNDSDPDGNALTVSARTNGAHGTVTINTGGASLTYSPATGYTGTDSFTYTVSDGAGGSATATVAVTVTASNSVPNAVNDTVTSEGPINAFIPLIVDVLANDTDADGHSLTVTSVSTPGTIASNKVKFTSMPEGVSYYTYAISDGNGGSDTATIQVTYTPCGQQCP